MSSLLLSTNIVKGTMMYRDDEDAIRNHLNVAASTALLGEITTDPDVKNHYFRTIIEQIQDVTAILNHQKCLEALKR